jgi:hypothetical protein
MAKTAFTPYQRKRAGERLLPHILDLFSAAQPRSQFQQNEFTKVSDEMLFSRCISRTELVHIGGIERREIH